MYPIPILYMLTEGGIIPIPPGAVKSVATLRYTPLLSPSTMAAVAILLHDGRLLLEGDNAVGELANGNTFPQKDVFIVSRLDVDEVYNGDRSFIVKTKSGDWFYSGSSCCVDGGNTITMTWNAFPSSFTSVVDMSTVVNVKGDQIGATLYLTNTGALYGVGLNGNGSLGNASTDPVTIPRRITTSSLDFYVSGSSCMYLNSLTDQVYVSGLTYGQMGGGDTGTQRTNFGLITVPPAYIQGFMTNPSYTVLFGSDTQAVGSPVSLYARGAAGFDSGTYGLVPGFMTGFTDWSIPPGNHSTFFIANGDLYAFGAYSPNAGVPGTPVTLNTPTIPTRSAEDPSDITPLPWDVNKIQNISAFINPDGSIGDPVGHLMVYDNNLYYTGQPPNGLFNSIFGVDTFVPMAKEVYQGIDAESLVTDSIPVAIVGTTAQFSWAVTPTNATIYDLQFTTSDPTIATIDANGIITFLAEGGVDITMTAKTGNLGVELSDTTGVYASVMSVSVDSIPAKVIGDSFQFVWKESPTWDPSIPEFVGFTVSPAGLLDLDGLSVEYTTTDDAVVSFDVNPGYGTCMDEGDCRCGLRFTLQSAVASDDSYVSVSQP